MRKVRGRPRTITDDQLRQILAYRPFAKLCREVGVSRSYAYQLREKHKRDGWVYKKQREQI